MARIQYKKTNFRASTLVIINQADDIIQEYAAQGYTLKLRQLFYQFVARGLLPNTDRSYDRLGQIINNARLNGLIDWYAITETHRKTNILMTFTGPESAIEEARDCFIMDLWENQDNYVEVWIEKDALSDVIARPCERLRVPYMACKGYLSQTMMWKASQRFQRAESEGRECYLLHLGDHDPSGIDMTRDTQDRLNMFRTNVEVKRLALNMPQVEKYGPPPNPSKTTDSRHKDYAKKFGDSSWELDALEPRVIADLVNSEIGYLINWDQWKEDTQREDNYKSDMDYMVHNFQEISDFIRERREEE